MAGHRERVEGPQVGQEVAELLGDGEVARQGGGVARDVRDGPRPQLGDLPHHPSTRPRPWRVQDHHVGPYAAARRLPQHRVDAALPHLDVRVLGEVVERVVHGFGIGLDGQDVPRLPHRIAEPRGEQPHAAVEVERVLALDGVEQLHHLCEEGRGGARVDLPEAARRDLEAVLPVLEADQLERRRVGAGGPVGVQRHEHRLLEARGVHDVDARAAVPRGGEHAAVDDRAGRDQAVVDDLDLVRAVPAQPRATLGGDGELDPRAPAQPVVGARALHRLHDQALHVEAGEAVQLLADDGGLELALVRQGRVLPVAAATATGPGIRAGWLDPVRRGDQHLDGVRPQEAVARAALGDPDAHALPRQAVSDEDDAAVEAPDAEATVADVADLELGLRADQRLPLDAALAGGRGPGSAPPTVTGGPAGATGRALGGAVGSAHGVGPSSAWTRPRPRSWAAVAASSSSRRSSDERSW